MALECKEKEESEIKLLKLIIKFVEYALVRIDSVPGKINIVGEIFLFGIAIATFFKSLFDTVKEILQLFVNMILVLFNKTTQVQESENIFWVTAICALVLLIEHIVCVCFVGRNAELRKSNLT